MGNWIKFSYDESKEQPFDFDTKYWFALNDGSVVLGSYEWRQGYGQGDMVISDSGVYRLKEVVFYQIYAEPEHPFKGKN
jgi:hypothetical protein